MNANQSNKKHNANISLQNVVEWKHKVPVNLSTLSNVQIHHNCT